ncbi:transcriptional repressor LexA [Candidatus Methylacidithermus pantelleriae]|uniref:LexA repressor n=1 Tax=Candidatus Methylacidithermus pantelleriae TaxID=2744239 RepID=A0A8J2BR79_9BACT|nr:transcriptional repressor LexA [Candidatus Methylacidithermus pantelleriae]CAF0700912.1 LexA repressor [Candidatus Methylacidithermus pantelleriae]
MTDRSQEIASHRGAKRPDPSGKVLAFLNEYLALHQRPPTIREIQGYLGYRSPRAVSYVLEKLERAGAITRRPKARGIFPTKLLASKNREEIPLYECIPAGWPDWNSAENPPQTLGIDPHALGISDPTRAFAVVVRGQSMVGAGIQDGDIVIFERRPVNEGDIVAALIDGECTLKRLVRRGAGYWLASENPSYPALRPAEELAVQGVAIAVIRRLCST